MSTVDESHPLEVRYNGDSGIWSHVRKRWLVMTPEEMVRQGYLLTLVNEYGWTLDHIAEEITVTGRGSARARADFVIWRTVEDRQRERPPLIIVECKADNVRISPADYGQGDNYARLANAQFVATHNNQETRFWRVLRDRMPGYLEEIEDIPTADASDSRIKYLLENLKTFREDEFATLLAGCHNIIRDRDHLDPAAAFDEIAKILFLKTTVERRLREGRSRRNVFTAEFLDEQAEFQKDPANSLFLEAKEYYSAAGIFAGSSKIELRYETVREIVRLLERYNLSDTSEDIKGIAFERFLGRTFRGEIGQFFTPRPIVHLMVGMMDPAEGERILDPASGSGGFLIQAFLRVREKIASSVDAAYRQYKGANVDADPEDLSLKFEELSRELDAKKPDTRAWRLANWAVNGVDANDRMARTSKMNMIMHGDGHGGVHHANGLLDVGTVIPGQFDLIMTNPPFGSDVPRGAVVLREDVARDHQADVELKDLLGEKYSDYRRDLKATEGKPILDLFDLSRGQKSAVKTEVLFLERCLDLLRPGGRMAIVLPEGVLSNPTSEHLREHSERRAFLRAVVSLPKDTFKSTSADVRTSVVVLQKFTDEERRVEEDRLRAAREKAKEQLAQAQEAATREIEQGQGSTAIKARELRKVRTVWEAEAELAAKRIYFSGRAEHVFMYEAEDVGITATGEPAPNELYPNPAKPEAIGSTCLELWELFTAGELEQDSDLLTSRGFWSPRSNLARWDVKSARATEFRRMHPDYVPLSEYLEDATSLVKPSSRPEDKWNVYGVSNVQGVFLSSTVLGSEIKQTCKAIDKDYFFHNPTRANVGSLGRVHDVLPNAITSPEYQVWKIRQGAELLPDFMEVLLKTDYFLRLVAVHRRGAVKERLYLENLFEIVIPRLSVEEQQEVVESWFEAQRKLNEARMRVDGVVDQLDQRLT